VKEIFKLAFFKWPSQVTKYQTLPMQPEFCACGQFKIVQYLIMIIRYYPHPNPTSFCTQNGYTPENRATNALAINKIIYFKSQVF